MSNNPVIKEDEYGCPEPFYNYGIPLIYRLMCYGKGLQNKPDAILPPIRKQVTPTPIQEYFCTNGHFYQPGRLHSLVSGSNVRLFGHGGHFSGFDADGKLLPFSEIKDALFRVNYLPWVGNGGLGTSLLNLLKNTYKPYGLRPTLAFTGTPDKVRLVWNMYTHQESAPVDENNPDFITPAILPKNAMYGLNERLTQTANPYSYKTMAKLGYALAAVYGKNAVGGTEHYLTEPETPTGLDLLAGFEYCNEPDKGWMGVMNCRLPEELIAGLSAMQDGHRGVLYDEDGVNTYYGATQADPNFKALYPGLVSSFSGYLFYTLLWSKVNRK
ncbi:MAG: hypothetical protein EOM35_07075 [Negativicutes bacterium]|nr:hypothetical protein [Negativicutes bacterium]